MSRNFDVSVNLGGCHGQIGKEPARDFPESTLCDSGREAVDGRADPAQADYMTGDPSPSPFELAARELRVLGITLANLPGEYRVNYRNGSDATARMGETLDEALELGRSMAADAAAPAGPAQGKRRRRPLRMTPKAVNRRRRMAQLRRMRARALRKDGNR